MCIKDEWEKPKTSGTWQFRRKKHFVDDRGQMTMARIVVANRKPKVA